ncbi:MAG: peptidoglycan DD-metalloendopeptidase family protein [Gammaproteobacteria bacterium]|nr:peptidoglycan DD-metalloendopeptidase family protein [Gammaproteobacteria bacterium]
MKKFYTITISDSNGSKYFSFGKNIKKNIILLSLALFCFIVSSLFATIFQSTRVDTLVGEIDIRDAKMSQFDSISSRLESTIGSQKALISNISKELVDIERTSGVETSDINLGLEERVRIVKQFYSLKEEEYTEIGSRVEQIEGMIGLDNPEEDIQSIDLAERVELASLNASQERMFYDNIPNGFPTKLNVITSNFGSRVHPVTKIKSFHKGVDLRAKMGQEIFVTADGIVSSSGYTKLSGNRVVVSHNFGFETRYSHLKKSRVKVGTIVQKGDLVGISGNTGRSSAPHLHYEVRYLGKAIDPKQFLKRELGSHEIFTKVRGIQWPSLITLINKQILHQTLQLSQLDPSLQEKLN